MSKYERIGPNRVRTPTGSELELVGRAGLILERAGERLEVDSEMLDPPMAVAVYAGSIPTQATTPAHAILEEILEALIWMGFTVEVIGTPS
jgi:hypothetical protein